MILINVYTAILINTFGEETIKIKKKFKRLQTMSLDYPKILAPLLKKFHPIIMRKIMPIIKESKLILAYLAKIFLANSELTKPSKVTPNKRQNLVNKVILIENSGEKVKEVNFSEPKNQAMKRDHQSTDFYEVPIVAKVKIAEVEKQQEVNQDQNKENLPI